MPIPGLSQHLPVPLGKIQLEDKNAKSNLTSGWLQPTTTIIIPIPAPWEELDRVTKNTISNLTDCVINNNILHACDLINKSEWLEVCWVRSYKKNELGTNCKSEEKRVNWEDGEGLRKLWFWDGYQIELIKSFEGEVRSLKITIYAQEYQNGQSNNDLQDRYIWRNIKNISLN